MENTIETNDLTKTFQQGSWPPRLLASSAARAKSIVAVDHVNLKILPGECFGLLGPNGAGKTTLIKMLCTLIPPDEGTGRVNGFDIVKEQMDVKKSLGTLFSLGERGFFWRLSGFRNLEFYAAVYNLPRSRRAERIKEVLKIVGLSELADKPLQKYSGGIRRRLALARALLPDPPILLLDEATLQLDVGSSREIRRFIRDTLSREQKKTILYTTHNVEETRQLCDRVAIMNKGRIVASGLPEEIRTAAKKGYDFDILVHSSADPQIDTLRAMSHVLNLETELVDAKDGTYRLSIRLDSMDSLSEALAELARKNLNLIKITERESSMEDAVIQLTNTGA